MIHLHKLIFIWNVPNFGSYFYQSVYAIMNWSSCVFVRCRRRRLWTAVLASGVSIETMPMKYCQCDPRSPVFLPPVYAVELRFLSSQIRVSRSLGQGQRHNYKLENAKFSIRTPVYLWFYLSKTKVTNYVKVIPKSNCKIALLTEW